MKPRVGIISIHPAPYRDYTHASLHKRGNVDVTILQIDPVDYGHQEWNFSPSDYPVLYLKHITLFGYRIFNGLSLLNTLRRERYDVLIIPGYTRAATIISILFSIITGTPYILALDTVSAGKHTAFSWLRNKVKHKLYGKSAAFLVPGAASRHYLEATGVLGLSVYEGYYCLSCKSLLLDIQNKKQQSSKLRAELGIPANNICFLSVGKMNPSRGYIDLVNAFLSSALYLPIYLVLVGNGLDEENIKKLCARDFSNRVSLLGPLPFSQLSAIYALADVYIHTGGEPYSTAMEYGALAGLPIATRLSVGFVHDLLAQGGEPIIIDSGSTHEIAESLSWIVNNWESVKATGTANFSVIQSRTVDWAAGQVEAAVFAIDSSRLKTNHKVLPLI